MSKLSGHKNPDAEQDMLLKVVAETLEFDPWQLELDTDLLATGRMDSLTIVTLVSFMEDRMAVSLPIEQIIPENFRSVRHLLSLAHEARQITNQ